MSTLKKVFDFLFPEHCVWCWTQGTYICSTCKKNLVPHPDRCPFCHRVMPFGQTCWNCLPYHRHLAGIGVAFVYTTTIKSLILGLKFFHKRHIAWFLAQRLTLLIQTNPALNKTLNEKSLYVTYVPSHRYRKRFVKWYNQSELLAREVSKTLNVPLLHGLEKTKRTWSQTKKSRKERLVNLIDAFTLKHCQKIPLCSTLIIIDDITTTWSTIDEVAKTRKKSDSSLTIWWVVVGRHGK